MIFIFKNILTIFLFIGAAGTFGIYSYDHQLTQTASQHQIQEKPKETQIVYDDQYTISLSLTGNKTELIDLRKGLVKFDIKHYDKSDFSASIYKNTGELLENLINTNGVFQQSKTFEVPETGQYLLNVECKGSWNITQE